MLGIKSYVIKWKEALKERISKLMRKPVLVIVQMASNRDVRNKVKDANEVGIDVVVAHFEEDNFETIEQFKDKVTELAMNGADGIIVQLPLPEKFNNIKYLLENVPAHMDVDGVSGKPGAQTPCTPFGIINEKRFIDKLFKRALVIGFPTNLLRPMAKLLLDNGINSDVDGKMRGDCYIGDPEVKTIAVSGSGGVGLLTRCALMENTVRSCEWQEEEMERVRYEITL